MRLCLSRSITFSLQTPSTASRISWVWHASSRQPSSPKGNSELSIGIVVVVMTAIFAILCAGRMHYAWVVLAVMFSASMAGVGVRAAPGVMIVPSQHAFGWDVSTISGAISINIILLGATGPFLTGLTEVIGLKRTILGCMMMLMAGSGLSVFM